MNAARPAWGALLVLALGSAAAVAASNLPAWLGLVLWLLALGWSIRVLQRALSWRVLVLHTPDQIELQRAEDDGIIVGYRAHRRSGPLLQLWLDRDGRRWPLLLWLPALKLNQRRKLLRGLAQMTPPAAVTA